METASRHLDEASKNAIRKAFSALRGAMPNYRPRASQNYMIAAASRALGRNGGVALIEAPTGTGKSMGYLVPALPLVVEQGMRVVISTATVALQEQVFSRDLPLFLAATKIGVDAVLAKGRNRYACVARLAEMAGLITADPLFDELNADDGHVAPAQACVQLANELIDLVESLQWDGDLDNIPLQVDDQMRAQMSCPQGQCLGHRCAFFRQCTVERARNQVRGANVVLANHALTMAYLKQIAQIDASDEPSADASAQDSASDRYARTLFGDPGKLLFVFDEGHHLGAVGVDDSQVGLFLGALEQQRARALKLVSTIFRATGGKLPPALSHTRAAEAVASHYDALLDLRHLLDQEWSRVRDDERAVHRLPRGEVPAHWIGQLMSSYKAARELVNLLVDLGDAIGELPLRAAVTDGLLRQLGGQHHQHANCAQVLLAWTEPDTGMPTARWLSQDARGALSLHASAISAAPFLSQTLWRRAGSVVVTSATLSNGGDFSLLCDELGVPSQAELASLASPFDLPNQAVLRVPNFPTLPDDPEHARRIAEWLFAELDWAEATLVLFTSRRKMFECHAALPQPHRERVLVQGAGGKAALLAEHIQRVESGQGSVLFGLTSLGEGLDLAGKRLTHVVCTQTPFAVPEDPVGKTLAEWVEYNGGNPFADIAVPAATRTLTQYAGRLIRTETDTGRVTLLDRRLVKRRYGSRILNALPPFRREIQS